MHDPLFMSQSLIDPSSLEETNFFPLYEYDNGQFKVKKNKKTKPVKEYLELQGRFSHLTDEEIDNIQKNVDRDFEKLLRLEEFGKKYGEI